MKDNEREIGGRIGEKKRRGEGGVARRKRVAHLTKVQQRAQIAKGQQAKGERKKLRDGGLKMTERIRGGCAR